MCFRKSNCVIKFDHNSNKKFLKSETKLSSKFKK